MGGGGGYVCNKMKMGRQDVGGYLWSPGYESNCNVEYKIKCLAKMQWESPRHGNIPEMSLSCIELC